MRKSQQIRALEARHGKPLAEIVAEAYERHGTIEAAARSLQVNANTFAFWKARLVRVETTRRVRVA